MFESPCVHPPLFKIRSWLCCYVVCQLHVHVECCNILQGGREVSDFIDFLKKNASNQPVNIAGGAEDEEVKEEKKKKKKKAKKEEL